MANTLYFLDTNILVHLVREDGIGQHLKDTYSSNDGKPDYDDRKTIAIADPSGANYAEVITEADEILQRTMHSESKLTVIYQSNAKLFIADIDLPQRQVTTKDLPATP